MYKNFISYDGKKAEIEALKAAHKEELARLCEKDRTVSDPAKVADELSHILGVKK